MKKKFGANVDASVAINNLLDNQYRYDASQSGYPFFNSFIGAAPLGRRVFVSLPYTSQASPHCGTRSPAQAGLLFSGR